MERMTEVIDTPTQPLDSRAHMGDGDGAAAEAGAGPDRNEPESVTLEGGAAQTVTLPAPDGATEGNDVQTYPVEGDEDDQRDRLFAACNDSDCGIGLCYRKTESGNGVIVLTVYNADPDTTFALGAAGLPICPEGHGDLIPVGGFLTQHTANHQQVGKAIPVGGKAPTSITQAIQMALPGTTNPFNYEGAYLELEAKAQECDRLQKIAEEDAETARASKKAWQKAAELYSALGIALRDRRLAKAPTVDDDPADRPAEVEPPLPFAAPAEPRLVRCAVERDDPTQTCPICADPDAAAARGFTAAPDAAVHVDQAIALAKLQSVDWIKADLAAAGIVVPHNTLLGWSKKDREQILVWALGPRDASTARPKVLKGAHVADVVADGDPIQKCHECGEPVLDEGGLVPLTPYPVGTLVGSTCKGGGQNYPKRKRGRPRKTAAAPAADVSATPEATPGTDQE
jgi:hypothetical protein